MNFEEQAVTFPCAGTWLHGIASVPSAPSARGVLIVVGGPQYRVGSHRQFTLLARDLATSGTPSFRFDYRGMGDSEGASRNFEDIDVDLQAAIDTFFSTVPCVSEVVIWGLCDAASAAAFYAHRDKRVTGLVLLNPWVRSERGIAKTYVKSYYFSRLFSSELWRKILCGKLNYLATTRTFWTEAKRAFLPIKGANLDATNTSTDGSECTSGQDLPGRVYEGLDQFGGRILIILSENDLTAREFLQLTNSERRWRKLLSSGRVKSFTLPCANHTFARREWRDQVSRWTRMWISQW